MVARARRPAHEQCAGAGKHTAFGARTLECQRIQKIPGQKIRSEGTVKCLEWRALRAGVAHATLGQLRNPVRADEQFVEQYVEMLRARRPGMRAAHGTHPFRWKIRVDRASR